MADPYSACLPPVRLPEHLDKAGKRIYRGLAGGLGSFDVTFMLGGLSCRL